MKKGLLKYSILWLIALGLFNAITFLVPTETDSLLFWLGYAFISLAFVSQLVATGLVFQKDLLQKRIGSMPLTVFSFLVLILLLVAGCVLTKISAVPTWVAILVCYLIVIVQYIANLVALAGAGDKGSAKGFVAELKQSTEALAQKAAGDEIKALADEVCAAVRASDPFSDAALAGVENKINDALSAFSSAVEAGDAENAKVHAKQLLTYIKERNAKCRILK